MNRDRLLLAVASVLAGTAVLMAVFGFTFNLVFFVVALPFGAAAYFLWADATGRLEARMRSRARRKRASGRTRAADGGRDRRRARERVERPRPEGPSRKEARRVLDVEADAEGETIRRAYRERVKEAHPDREGGSEEAFKRVQDAYDRLSEE